MFARMLDHPRIRVLLDCDFAEVRHLIVPRRATVYSGPVDAYFDFRLGKLPYRSLSFDLVTYRKEVHQPCVQINHPNEHAYTRSVEFKHVTGQRHPHTVVSYETPRAVGEPYYPVPMPANTALYERYRALAEQEKRRRRVFFCGRLAQYRYFNTDEVILEALRCFEEIRKTCAAPARSASLPMISTT
jgi:UDP-galactopyranose mutase